MKGLIVMLPPIPYNRAAAVAYAHKWAFARNPDFYNYDAIGGDCTNFASQCLFTGTGVMNYTRTFGWYYIDANRKAPAWTGVPYFNQFLTRMPPPGPGPVAIDTDMERMEPGDFVQLRFKPDIFDHTPVVVAVGNPPTLDNILIAAHSYNTDNQPLSTYTNVHEYRFLHVLGAYFPLEHDSRREDLL